MEYFSEKEEELILQTSEYKNLKTVLNEEFL